METFRMVLFLIMTVMAMFMINKAEKYHDLYEQCVLLEVKE